ncbi:MAG: c-type cytochrome [Minwuia sp.]|uniref:c-type cytochrome n=1 Tax=Minwuia sp. TaxID=2493630 RepID=UPI003A86D88B
MTHHSLAGDPAYGEYLSGECVACHQKSGAADGIPSIIGWDEISFVAVMLSYKQGGRENEVMQNVARSLDQEQIEALAAYFARLEAREMSQGEKQ